MMKLVVSVALALAAGHARAQATVPEWGQCGGIGWTGGTVCASGLSCVVLNAWFSQCLTSTTTAPSITPPPITPPPITPPPTTPLPTTTLPTTTPPSSTGFVKTSGTKFTLNGGEYTVVGGNAYWVGLFGLSNADMNTAFADIARAGGTTVRTLGFNEVINGSTYPGEDYYQIWTGSTPTINTGPTGLENFDNVVAAAKANGIRLIITLTNNWSDYGGMDVYVNQLLGAGQPHDYFYTNPTVINAYKNYVKAFVTRYLNEPTILAWELANEPRCQGTTSAVSGTCTAATITAWAKTISAYIKSIDSNHLVAIGDEGFYNEPTASTYPYQAGNSLGIDFDANLAISTLDFGTFHSYPVGYGQTADPGDWGIQWINDHATSMKNQGKPVILEEFGMTFNQSAVYTTWFSAILSSGLTGDIIWQSGSNLSTGPTPDDGYAIYPNDPVYPLLAQHAAALKARG